MEILGPKYHICNGCWDLIPSYSNLRNVEDCSLQATSRRPHVADAVQVAEIVCLFVCVCIVICRPHYVGHMWQRLCKLLKLFVYLCVCVCVCSCCCFLYFFGYLHSFLRILSPHASPCSYALLLQPVEEFGNEGT